MRLLFVTDLAFPDHAGGSHRVYYEVAKRLAARGHEVHLVTGKVAADAPDEETIDGVCYHRLSRDRRNFVAHGLSYVLGARRVYGRLARSAPFDLISAHYILPTLGVLSARRRGGPPIVFSFYGPWAGEFAVELGWQRRQGPRAARLRRALVALPTLAVARALEWLALRQSVRVHHLSHFTAALAAREYGVAQRKTVVIPAGVDVARFAPPSDKAAVRAALGLPADRPLLLTVRRLYARMGLENLVEAMVAVARARPEALLLIGGTGPLGEALAAQVARLGLAENVRLLGFVPDEQLPLFYQAADGFVLPTTDLEGFGLVTLEALACGTPVVGTPVGGTVEILGGLDPALLTRSPAPAHLADAILRHLAAPSPSPEQCRRYVLARYTWERMVDQLEQLFEEVAAERLTEKKPRRHGGHGERRE